MGYDITDREKQAESFQLGRNITVDSIKLMIQKTNSPSDNVVVRIETDLNGSPS
jgi:hypothetical protein